MNAAAARSAGRCRPTDLTVALKSGETLVGGVFSRPTVYRGVI